MRPEAKLERRQLRQTPVVRSRRVRSKIRSRDSVKEIRGLKIIDQELASGYVREETELGTIPLG